MRKSYRPLAHRHSAIATLLSYAVGKNDICAGGETVMTPSPAAHQLCAEHKIGPQVFFSK